MTSIGRLASSQDKWDTQIALDAFTSRVAAGFDTHLAIRVVDPGAAKVASSGAAALSPNGELARAGELAAMLNQPVA